MEQVPMSSPKEHSHSQSKIKLSRKERFWAVGAALFALLISLPCNAHKFPLTVNEKQPALVGRVTDSDLKPLAGVQLKLTSPDTNLKITAVTKGDGSFSIAHDPCKICQLEVYPPKDSKLASALLDNLSGESTRRLIIQLREGIHVMGKVTGGGKGLKGLDLTFVPVDASTSKRSSVHGSGMTKTGKNGSFSLTVTPGMNQLTIDNDRYPEFKDHFETKVNVTGGGDIPDLVLPPAQSTH
jgi:hypothetical protein